MDQLAIEWKQPNPIERNDGITMPDMYLGMTYDDNKLVNIV
jgi:hypothetical protein